jgi:hypothetical protein
LSVVAMGTVGFNQKGDNIGLVMYEFLLIIKNNMGRILNNIIFHGHIKQN